MAEYEVLKEGQEEVLKVDANKWPYSCSIEDNASVMNLVIGMLADVPHVSRLIINQRRNYGYDYEQTQMLIEVANLYNHLSKQKKISYSSVGPDIECNRCFATRYADLQYILNNLKADPIGAYVELKRISRNEEINLKKQSSKLCINCIEHYTNLMNELIGLVDKLKIVQIVKEDLAGYKIGDRSFYREILRPTITPDFMFTRLMLQVPANAEQIDVYSLENAEINIYKVPGDVRYFYHLTPIEFKLTEDKYILLDLARSVVAEHKPREEEFLDPERMRRTFFNIGRDLIMELAQNKGISLSLEEVEQLAKILVRYTVGFGLVEVLLEDEKIQDIVVNGPIGQTPIFIVHQDFEECVTNIIPSSEDAESWASKFRMLSGRPLDEANPVLDTELAIPSARARVAVITNPLNPFGLGYSLRRHRDEPWTYPLYIKNKMLNPLAAGLLSFLVDGARSILFGGTRSSGKTSLLGATLLEMMRKYRVISVEDSVTNDSEILIRKNGIWQRTSIGYLIDTLIEKYGCWYNLSEHEILGNDENIEILAMNKEGKIVLKKVSKFIRHKVKKPIYKITTRTGRQIKVTGDHSLFNLNNEGEICEVKAKELKKGSFIATPRDLSLTGKNLSEINLLENLDKIERAYIYGGNTKEFLKKHYHEIHQLGKEYRHDRSLRSRWFRKGIIPIKILKDLKSLGYNINEINGAYLKFWSSSKGIPIRIQLNQPLLILIGLWLADGSYDRSSVILSSVDPEERNVVYSVAKQLNLAVKNHSDRFSLMINSIAFKTFLREILELKGDAYTKRIPNWIFSLNKNQVGCILRGLFSGDGHVSKNEIMLALSSINMLRDIQTLLLRFGIVHRIGKLGNDKTYDSAISANKFIKKFLEIGFLQRYKNENLKKLSSKISTHDVTDIIPLTLDLKKQLSNLLTNSRFGDYLYGQLSNIGREKMSQMIKKEYVESNLLKNMRLLINSDIFWDEIRDVEMINDFNGYVYDISVPECESFVVGNIIAHNTLELPNEAMRKLGYNIQAMKVRAALMSGGAEVPADEGIRTSLRMGDSSLIVGEIRSLEAMALFESMRIGALANVVAGTIHGADPYSIFDRVVNDLKVPRTSFKAVDVIIISNPIKSSDGLHKWKRVLQIAEVRKHWEEDPLREHGFVDLMTYDSKEDVLKPSKDLINGDSETLKSIAGNVKEWAGNWDAIWENILLRAKIKETLVNYAEKTKLNDLLEARFVVNSNDMFHRISDEVRQEVGYLDSKMIFEKWDKWIRGNIKGV